jgi:hypothetical protein
MDVVKINCWGLSLFVQIIVVFLVKRDDKCNLSIVYI